MDTGPGAGAAASTRVEPKPVVSAAADDPQAATGDAAIGGQSAPWYSVVALAALATLICSIDRAAMSVTILPMSEQYGWSDTTKGAINSAFYAGYMITNMVGGYLASSIGAKRTLGSGVVFWSAFTILTPLAAGTRSLPLLLGARGLMGCGEGTAYPCVQSVVKGWVPTGNRSRALTAIYTGGQLGTVVALLTAPLIIEAFGWPGVFYVYGSLGLAWAAVWQVVVASSPPLYRKRAQQGPAPASGPPALSDADYCPDEPMPSPLALPWRRFLTNKPLLGLMGAHGMFGSAHYILLSWMPVWYNQSYGLDVAGSSTLSVLPWVGAAIVSNFAGWAADHLTNEGHLSMTATRKLMQVTGSLGPALCLWYLAAYQQSMDVAGASAVMVATVSIGGLQSAGFGANHQDLAGPKYAPILFGLTNTLCSLVGSASVFATGVLLDSGYSWAAVFSLAAALYTTGAMAFLAWGSGERQFE